MRAAGGEPTASAGLLGSGEAGRPPHALPRVQRQHGVTLSQRWLRSRAEAFSRGRGRRGARPPQSCEGALRDVPTPRGRVWARGKAARTQERGPWVATHVGEIGASRNEVAHSAQGQGTSQTGDGQRALQVGTPGKTATPALALWPPGHSPTGEGRGGDRRLQLL